MSPTKRRRSGRPAEGIAGERVSDYPQVMIRLPRATKNLLDALRGVTGVPIWRLVDQAVATYVDQLPEPERKLLVGVRDRRATHRERDQASSRHS